jgi:large subunit ribosomal protein L25
VAERVRIQARERETRGSRESRRLRRQGQIPGVVYGRGRPARPICIEERELRRALSGPGGLHAILDVVLDGGSPSPAVLKDYQQDPIRGTLIHFDLHEVRLDQPIQTSVVVQLVGESAGAKEGGVLSQVTRELNVQALPMEIPEHIDADVSEMHIGDTLRLADLPPIDGVTFLDDPEETVLATVTQPTRVELPEDLVEEEAEEGEEGVAPEGEEAPEGGAEAAAAPGSLGAAGDEGEPGTTPG